MFCGATIDNGTNVIKAVELMRINHVSCFGHTLNNGVMSSMHGWIQGGHWGQVPPPLE